MAYESNLVHLIGNLVRDPELRYTAQGKAVCNVSVAHNKGKDDDNPTFVTVTCWEQLAENVAEEFSKGDRVQLVGSLRLNKWTTDGGEERQRLEVTADEVSRSLRFAGKSSVPPAAESSGSPQPPSYEDVPF